MSITCTKCKQDKECSDFYPSTLRTTTKWCKQCHGMASRSWASRNRVRERARVKAFHAKTRAARSDYAKWHRLLSKYGVTKDQYIVMLARQEFCCAICNESLINKPRVSVDHSHVTDKVRGVLCNSCNRGIGLLKDNPTVLTNAARYISTHSLENRT